ncbi:C-type lectin lectoxin-Thr1-like isoform X1 [Erythrolamprus reginae]|uniref:C-type lectin lectoxin-Thr1-like isoform X1 n=1 Tax=Erythrolamprus reginae TaxID=121349 RepID=UPI00396C8D47
MGRFFFVTLGLLIMAFSLNGAKGCCCPPDWLPMNTFCYKVFDEHKTGPDAETFCGKHKPDCHLASIHGSEESLELAQYISFSLQSSANVWIGLHDPEKNRNWRWTDGSKSSYRAWDLGEPNYDGSNANCVELLGTGYEKWNDENCASRQAFLCQCRFYCKLSPSCCRGKKAPGGA